MPSTRPSPALQPARRAHMPRVIRGWLGAALFGVGLGALGLLAGAGPAQTQSFGAALYVNDHAITHYEIDQRARFLEFIGVGGSDTRALARERLIEDALQMQEARRLGLRATPEQITLAMDEFAARAEMTGARLIEMLRQAGIDPETFRNFIHAGVVWRDLVNARYGAQVRVTDAQVDQAISVEAVRPVTEVLLSEIFLPSDPQFAEPVGQIIPQILAIRSEAEFSNAARQVSAAPSGEQGGRIDRWIELGSLPPPIASAVADAPTGAIIGPIEVPGAYAIFQLRARRDTRDVPSGLVEVEFRRAALAGGRSETNLARLAELRARTDGCADFGRTLAQLAPELPEGAAETLTRRQSELDTGTATELGRLNPGQMSANMVENGNLVVLMLCARRVVPDPAPPVAEIRMNLYNVALEGVATVYLQMLRAEAEIRTR